MGAGPDRLSPDPAGTARANGLAALTLLSALQRRGMEHLVLCPGSRSAPLAVAAALLEGRGLRLHTAIDERSAAFFALGLGRAVGRPAAVVTTSGTAVAQLLAAAVEADLGTIPLLLLTADRPEQLKNCGANQSVPQERFLVASCRCLLQGPPQGLAGAPAEALERLAAEAMAAACGDGRQSPAGPVHLNLPFDEPLHAGDVDLAALAGALAGLSAPVAGSLASPSPDLAPLAFRERVDRERVDRNSAARDSPARDGAPPDSVAQDSAVRDSAAAALLDSEGMQPLPPGVAPMPRLDPDRPGVVVAGPWRGAPAEWEAHCRALVHWQRRSGWPVLADGLSGLRGLPDLEVVAAYDLLLEAPPASLAGMQVLRLGSLPASRRLQRWLTACGGDQVLVSQGDPRRLDPLGTVPPGGQWSGGLAAWVEGQLEASESAPLLEADSAASRALAQRWRQLEISAQQLLDREWVGVEDGPVTASGLGAEVGHGDQGNGPAGGAPAGSVVEASGVGAGEVQDSGWAGSGAGGTGALGTGVGDSGAADSVAVAGGSVGAAQGEAATGIAAGSGAAGGDLVGGGHAGTGHPDSGHAPSGHAGSSLAAGGQAVVASAPASGGDSDTLISEPWLARALSRLLPAGLPLMLASSSPVRDWESFADPRAPWRPMHGFRGASGIDGTLSIACGLAEACGQLVLVSGDLALLHDANGWLWSRQLRGRLTVVLIENGGGGIFEQLPIRPKAPQHLDFERLFAMPQGVDQLALAALHGVPGRRVQQPACLQADLAWALAQPFALLEVRTQRRADAALRGRLRAAVAASATASLMRMDLQDPSRP